MKKLICKLFTYAYFVNKRPNFRRLICAAIAFFIFLNTCVFAVINNGPDTVNKNIVVLFAHGFGGTGTSCARYYSQSGVLPGFQAVSFEFPDSIKRKENNGKLNKKRTCFGQEKEAEILKNNVLAQNAVGNKVLAVGVSRGAMCVLTANIPQVVGRFAESPCASLTDIIDHKCKQFGFGWMPFLSSFIHNWVLSPFVFNSYDPQGEQPIEMVKNIPLDTPIFISYTTNDTLIPASSSVRLAEELVATGHTNIYVYGSNLGCHAHMLYADEMYKKIFKAFLEKYGVIASGLDFADGQKLLESCKVQSFETIQNLRYDLEFVNWKKYWGRNLAGFFVFSAIAMQATKKLLNCAKNLKYKNAGYKHFCRSIFKMLPRLAG